MDPLGIHTHFSNIEDLPTWNDSTPPSYNVPGKENSEAPVFSCSPKINKRIVVWNGNLIDLKADSVVNVLNAESSYQKVPLFAHMIKDLGIVQQDEIIQELKYCRTGDVKLTKGHCLPCRYVIHTIAPRFTTRFVSAAENALYNSYRNSLLLLLEQNLQNIAIPPIHNMNLNYPMSPGAHIALRTIRRFMEKCNDVSRVLIQVPSEYKAVYDKCLPLYFPRNKSEELFSQANLPKDVGNENGEPIRPDRVIRISGNPIKRLGHGDNSDDEDKNCNVPRSSSVDPNCMKDAAHDLEELPGLHAFGRMEMDPDKRRQRGYSLEGPFEEMLTIQRRYERWLREAHQSNLSSVANLRCFYMSGTDTDGRAIFVVVGKLFPANNIDYRLAMMYMISVMDKAVNSEYIVVYLHTESTSENQPPLHFLRDISNLLDYRYKRNLYAFYIVHPSWWASVFTWCLTTFMTSNIKSKVHKIPSLSALYQYINPTQMDLPEFCYMYDRKITGDVHSSHYTESFGAL